MPVTATQKKSFFSKIAGFFKKAGYYVSEAFIKLFGKTQAQHFAVAAIELLKSKLGAIVVEVVKEVEAVGAGTDKRATAFAKIVAAAEAQGISAEKSVINMLIEIAVQSLGAFGAK